MTQDVPGIWARARQEQSATEAAGLVGLESD